MKKMLVAFTAMVSLAAFANTAEEASDLFKNRGADKENALKAAAIYKTLAASESNALAKAELLNKEAQSVYFYASRSAGDLRTKTFERGEEVAKASMKLLHKKVGKPKQSDYSGALAEAYYWYSANVGKIYENNPAGGAWRWINGDIKKKIYAAQKLDPSVEEYGPARVIGRVLHKLPGGDDDALKTLADGYAKSLVSVDGIETASNTTTTLYYLDILAQLKKKARFCEVYLNVMDLKGLLSDDGSFYAVLNANKIPEAKTDLPKLDSWTDFEAKKEARELAAQCL